MARHWRDGEKPRQDPYWIGRMIQDRVRSAADAWIESEMREDLARLMDDVRKGKNRDN